MLIKKGFLVVALFWAGLVPARMPMDLGHPLITNYPPEQYNADTQNWAAVTDRQGLLYVANNRGVLEFDGREWRLIQVGENLSARSVAVDQDNRIYVGALGDFGLLKADELGHYAFVSLGTLAGIDAQSIGDVVTTLVLDGQVFFLSGDGLYIYDGRSVTVIRPRTRFHLGFVAGGRFYLRQRELGLFVLDQGVLEPVDGGEMFAEDRIYAMLETGEAGRYIIASRDLGFTLFQPAAAPADRFSPHPALNRWKERFARVKVSVCDRLANGDIVLATTQDGLYVISPEGELRLHLNRELGLMDDVVYYVYRDALDNLVLCHSVGISYVETGSPFRFIHGSLGLKGAGNSAYLPDSGAGPGAEILLGTYQGLFVSRPGDSGQKTFSMVPGSSENWQILPFNQQILTADNRGVWRWDGGGLHPLLSRRLALSLLPVSGHPARLLVGTFDGLVRLDLNEQPGAKTLSLGNFSQPAFNLSASADGSLWLHTHSGDGIYRLFLDEKMEKVERVRQYKIEDGLPTNGGNLVFPGQNSLRVATRRGIYRYDAGRDHFEPDPLFGTSRMMQEAINIIHEDSRGDVWVLGEGGVGVYRNRAPGPYEVQDQPYSRLAHFHYQQYMTVFPDGRAMLAYKDGFITFSADLESAPRERPRFFCLIRNVESPGGSLFGGAASLVLDTGQTVWGKTPVLPFRRNKVRFTFATSFIEGMAQIEFSYWLRGFDSDWSSWSKQSISSYTNLDEGSYEFWVRARDCYGQISVPAVYRLVVLPPWYRTIWAYLLFVLAGLLMLSAIVKFYNRHLRREKEHLETLVAEKTRELREISLSDPLTGLRNRRFIEEIIMPEVRSFVSFKQHLLDSTDQRFPEARDSVFGLLLFDIDHFKAVNDQHGHEAGDRVLTQFAELLRTCIRSDDFIVRWGGEEFLVVLKKTMPDYVMPFAEKRRETMSRHPFILDDETYRILHRTVSIGVVTFPFYKQRPDLISFDQAIMLADLGLYHAKTHGRNQAVEIRPGERLPDTEALTKMVHSLEYGLEKGFLRLGE